MVEPAPRAYLTNPEYLKLLPVRERLQKSLRDADRDMNELQAKVEANTNIIVKVRAAPHHIWLNAFLSSHTDLTRRHVLSCSTAESVQANARDGAEAAWRGCRRAGQGAGRDRGVRDRLRALQASTHFTTHTREQLSLRWNVLPAVRQGRDHDKPPAALHYLRTTHTGGWAPRDRARNDRFLVFFSSIFISLSISCFMCWVVWRVEASLLLTPARPSAR